MARLQMVVAVMLFCMISWTNVHGSHDELAFDPTTKECFADLVFLLDSSGSMGEENWMKILDFVKSFVYRLHFSEQENQVAIISFGNQADLLLTFDRSLQLTYRQLNSTIDQIPWKNQFTNLAHALRLARTEVFTEAGGDRSNFPNVVVVITDGKPTMEEENTVNEASLIKNHREGTFVFTIGIGAEGISYQDLGVIATQNNDVYVYKVLEFSMLPDIINSITTNVCSQTTVCAAKDITFVLDSSGSMSVGNFRKSKDFVHKFVENVTMGSGASENQVGLVSYSTTAVLHAYLNQYETVQEFDEMVDIVPFANQRTNISGAIMLSKIGVFDVQPDSRQTQSDVLILITDGHDNTDMDLMFENARIAKEQGIRIFAIGVGNTVNMTNMMRLASAPGFFHTFVTESFDALTQSAQRGRGDTIYDLVCAPEPSFPPEYYDPKTTESSDPLFIILDNWSPSQDNFAELTEALAEALHETADHRRVVIITMSNGNVVVDLPMNSTNLQSRVRSITYAQSFSTSGYERRLVNAMETITGALSQLSDAQLMVITPNLLSDQSVRNAITNMNTALSGRLLAYNVHTGSEAGDDLLAPGQMPEMFSFHLREATGLQLTDFFLALCARSSIDAAEVMWECDFDELSNSTCGARNDGTRSAVQWTHKTDATPSRLTGPSGAFSPPYYLYLEATGLRYADSAQLMFETGFDGGPACLHFMYHMFGWHIGTLKIEVHRYVGEEVLDELPSVPTPDDQYRKRVVWLMSGPKGNEWKYAMAQLNLKPGDRIHIVAMRAHGYSGDIGLDNILLAHGPCEVSPAFQEVLVRYRKS